MTLDLLKENETATIESIADDSLAIQLLAMGFILGGKVTVERIAPLSDPIIIASDNNHVSIRKKDAKHIQINKI